MKEKAILRTLDSTIAVRFRNSRFEDVIEYLHTTLGLPILVDKNALEAAGVTYETAITLEAKGVTVRSLLRRLLTDLGLAYVIKEETIQVVTPQEAKESMVVRTYPIGDLIRPIDPAFLLLPAEFRRQKMLENAARLIDLIQSTVDPQNWRTNGGSATITFHELTMSLVIKAPTELHPVLSGGLR